MPKSTKKRESLNASVTDSQWSERVKWTLLQYTVIYKCNT